LRKPEPEVIADAPHRIDPDVNIPLLVLAKDADEFPAILTSVKVVVRQSGAAIREVELLPEPVRLHQRLWWNVFELSRNGINGWLDLDVYLTLITNGKTKTYRADNHRTSSHAPLHIYLSDEPLPGKPGVYFGDPHTHTERTDDQVEFGIPIDPAVTLSKALGLSFYCVADHSYDLDDSADDYSRNDPALPKWKSLIQDIQRKNSNDARFVVVQGEEISCRNSDERNVHFLLFGDEHFFPGSGDGAERWFKTRSEHSITDILEQKHKGAVAFAAHPLEHVSILQRLLLGRGSWSNKDLSDPRIAGIQFANGIRGKGFLDGYNAWIASLMNGRQVYCLAGNDAHGNFNRFRQIGIPFIAIRESSSQLFGKMRTAIFLEGRFDQSNILRSLGEGHFVITDGPFVNIVVKNSEETATSIGKTFVGSEFELVLTAKTTKEFGVIHELKVFLGIVGAEAERLFFFERFSGIFEYQRSFSVQVAGQMYLRAEAYSSSHNLSDNCEHFCFTNPIWFSPQSHA
jgi:hypothetical protein